MNRCFGWRKRPPSRRARRGDHLLWTKRRGRGGFNGLRFLILGGQTAGLVDRPIVIFGRRRSAGNARCGAWQHIYHEGRRTKRRFSFPVLTMAGDATIGGKRSLDLGQGEGGPVDGHFRNGRRNYNLDLAQGGYRAHGTR